MFIRSSLKEYELVFNKDRDLIAQLSLIQNSLYVIDEKVFDLYMNLFSSIQDKRILRIVAAEENKVIETALKICEAITELAVRRGVTLISIGGGIIQDISGFAANITYRGIKWIHIPTTLLSACDSCIGSKTSLNFKTYKNLLGTFYPPDLIYIEPSFFSTLLSKDYYSGLGEVIKFNIMSGESGLTNIENKIDYLLSRDNQTLMDFINSSLNYKKSFIEVDEFDKNERVKLNFAHTFGHAIETVTNYMIPHGTAVAIGMIMANYVSLQRDYISQSIMKRCENVLLKVIDINMDVLYVSIEKFIEAMRKDKKQINDKITLVIITKYGVSTELSIVSDVQENEIKNSFEYFLKLYSELK